jgi:HK97 gp10 family phage protein
MPARVSVSGSQEIMRKLARMGAEVQGQALQRALAAGALVVQNDAKVRAPFRTGTLRRSIHIGGFEDLAPDYQATPGRAGGVPGPEGTGAQVAVYVGTDLEYAAQREFGGTITARNARALRFKLPDGTWRTARSVTQEGTPYLRPAMDTNGPAVTREVGAALMQLLRRLAP